MSRTYRKHEGGTGRQRRISARAVRRNPPDLRLLSKALLMQAADEAAAATAASTPPADESTDDPDTRPEDPSTNRGDRR